MGSTSAGTFIASGATIDLNGQTYTDTEPLTVNGTGFGSTSTLYWGTTALTTAGTEIRGRRPSGVADPRDDAVRKKLQAPRRARLATSSMVWRVWQAA